MKQGKIKYVGTELVGYQNTTFDAGRIYYYKNNEENKYKIYDKKNGRLIETVGLRTFNKCFEGLNLPKKKYQDKIEGDYPDGYGLLTQYWNNGNIKFLDRTYGDGLWTKRYYDENGNETYYNDSDGFWIIKKYDENGNEIYYKDSADYRVKREYDENRNVIYFEDSYGYWEKFEYDEFGNISYYENSNGVIVDERQQNINEGLNLPKKKYQDKIDGNYPDGDGTLIQYWDNGKRKFLHQTYSDGSWWEETYNENGKLIYYKDSIGYWIKHKYDENGNQIYYENSDGEIIDNRPQNINEGLNLVKRINGMINFDNVTVFYETLPHDETTLKHSVINPVKLTYLVNGEEIPDTLKTPEDIKKHRELMSILNPIFKNKIEPYFEKLGYTLWIY